MSELALFGHNLFGDAVKPPASGPVAERFTFPPFTVLDARQGDWQDRKAAWTSMGIQGEVGRSDHANGASRQTGSVYLVKNASGNYATGGELVGSGEIGNSASIFDPVLTELSYRWFCPPGGVIVDPFAGGSVRGIVAGALGFQYWGCDLRQEQITANQQQGAFISPQVMPQWVCGDSRHALLEAPAADFLFTCPPYGDLERYSDEEADLSAMNWTGFTVAYRLILHRAAQRLRDHRFACVVVGNFRDEDGFYRDLVGETVAAMREAGLGYYNEGVLVTSVGSAALRVSRQFKGGRKLCKTHQNVLVFCKGDWRKANAAVEGVTP
jgi:hypothetical protein